MQPTETSTSRRRFSFSLGSLLWLITLVVFCLSALRAQQQLVGSQHLSTALRDLLPEAMLRDSTVWLLGLQGAGLMLAAASRFLGRMPTVFCVYLFCQSLWLVVAAIGFGLLHKSWMNPLWEALLTVYFCEPACGLVVAGSALFVAVWKREVLRSILAASLVAIGLMVCLLIVFEIQAFGAAIAGAIGAR